MAEVIHSMIRVLNLDDSIDFYRRALGLEVAGRFEFDDFTLVYLRGPEAGFELELVANHDRSEPYDTGDGYGHLAVRVDDVRTERQRHEAEGLAPGPVKELDHGGELLGRYFFVTDPDGYKVEILERAGRFA